MKVRLIKKENLMKAANRANLVKVAVQVNGRTGQYSSHRWKNPGAALNVLKETMKRAGVKTTDELEFKDRKSKKTLSEDELIKQYKESKTTDTLQDFVKKNYTVSKAKDEKAKEKGFEETRKNKTTREDVPKSKEKIESHDKGFEGSKEGYEGIVNLLKDDVGKEGVAIERTASKVYVTSPYHKKFIEDVKKIGGRWDRDRGQWHVRIDKEEELRDIVAKDYGWDERDNEYVAFAYNPQSLEEHGNEVRFGDIVIAKRASRDVPVELSRNTTIVKGKFSSSGGSRNNPSVEPDPDMMFTTMILKKEFDSTVASMSDSKKEDIEVVWKGRVGNKEELDSIEYEDQTTELKPLSGSQKQIAWAEDLRRDFCDNFKNLESKVTKHFEDKEGALQAALKRYADAKLNNTSSRDWIDDRYNLSESEILSKAVEKATKAKLYLSAYNFNNASVGETKYPKLDVENEKASKFREDYLKEGIARSYSIVQGTLATGPKHEAVLSDSDIKYVEHILGSANKTDPMYWMGLKQFIESTKKENPHMNPNKLNDEVIEYEHELSPLMVNDMDLPEEAREKAHLKRSELAANYMHERRYAAFRDKKRANGEETEGLGLSDMRSLKEKFQKNVSLSYWYGLAKDGVNSVEDMIDGDSTATDLSAYEIIFRSHSKRAREAREARHKDATKVDSKGDYKEVANYEELKKNLSLLKDSKTEVVGRAAMDMAGLTSPLYVKKEIPFIVGGTFANGYCEYDFSNPDNANNVVEIGVVDHKKNRQQSFKTSIHESMHGVFGNIKLSDGSPLATSLTRKNHEGMVEIIGQATTKAAYGDKYKDPMPSYLPFVIDTALRLRSRDEFKGKSIHKIGEYLGEKAIAKDAKYFEDLSGFLDKNKRVGLRGSVVKELFKDTDKVKTVAKKEHERIGKGDFEKSNLANLVEQMKAGLITLQGALNSSKYGDLAVILLYRLLEEDEEAAETLSAFQ